MELQKIKDVKLNPNNPRIIKDDKFQKLVASLQEFPEMATVRPIVCNTDMVILGGNMRFKAMQAAGWKEVPVQIVDWPEDKQAEFVIKDNVSGGEWDWDALANQWDAEKLEEWGLDLPVMLDADELNSQKDTTNLSDRFLFPPFSILDTKQGTWQQRKDYWLSLGIKSEIGRNASVFNVSGNIELTSDYDTSNFAESTKQFQKDLGTDGVSIFDPVLCEVAYRWFNIEGGKILDPFCGGSVRGIVAAKLGYEYFGIDLREEQIKANQENAVQVLGENIIYPSWRCGDSAKIQEIASDYTADLIFTCPPYFDLEVYSDKKEDLSNMSYNDFIISYKNIIDKSCELLKENRFAIFVIGEVRSKEGNYLPFISDTIQIFQESGLKLYNSMIVAKPIGNAAMRAAKYMNQRKVCLVHENMLVFYKGDMKKIKLNFPKLDFSQLAETSD
jgi:DNA modification methylase